jgi:hypothetical protein
VGESIEKTKYVNVFIESEREKRKEGEGRRREQQSNLLLKG